MRAAAANRVSEEFWATGNQRRTDGGRESVFGGELDDGGGHEVLRLDKVHTSVAVERGEDIRGTDVP